jgi:hypothetical protein
MIFRRPILRITTFSLTLALVPLTAFPSEIVEAPDPYSDFSGRALMELVAERHQQYPYVYEEQSMILIDQQGNKNTRKLRRYSRVDKTGRANFLLLFDSPLDVKGVALLAHREKDGESQQSFYLPAFGENFIRNDSGSDAQSSENFLGTDFSIENLVGETLESVQHIRQDDVYIDETPYYVVNVYHHSDDETGQPLRRHYILKETLFTARTDHFDELGRLKKRQTHHDLTNVHGAMWRANMMMMDNQQQDHRTIIKINRRVFSADYVPPEVFTESWIVANQGPPLSSEPIASEMSGEPMASTLDALNEGANFD